MFNIRFWQFDKRENSTKRPDHTQGIVIPCALKDNCSAINPVFEINTVLWPDGNPTGYNYCLCPTFGRYYFIRDWSYERGLWIAHLEVDVLASYRDQIATSKQYILRSNTFQAPYIADMIYPAKADPYLTTYTALSKWVPYIKGGTYVVGVINDDSDGIGAVHYYLFTQTNFNTFLQNMLNSPDWLEISDISANLQKALINPMQYIVSCVYIPLNIFTVLDVDITTAPDPLNSIKLGWWSFSATCYRMPEEPIVEIETTIGVPRHPDANNRGAYLNGPPFATYMFTYPAFGTFELPAVKLTTLSSLVCQILIDLVTGLAILRVKSASDGAILTTVRSQVGVPIQMAQMSTNPISNIGGIVSSVAGALGGGLIGGILGGLSAIGNIADFVSPDVETRGSNGSFVELDGQPRIDATFLKLVGDDPEHLGYPTCAKHTINEMFGYILVQDADIELVATAEENRRVKQYMDSGFYYE